MSYMSSHNNNRRERGRAAEHVCVDCGDAAKEWALQPGADIEVDDLGRTYSNDPFDYAPKCYRCHRLQDKAMITHCPAGHSYDGDNLIVDAGKRKCRTCVYERNRARRAANPMTPAQKARKLELQRIRRAGGGA